MSHEVESMAYVREVPWHGLGTKVDQAMTGAEALKLGGIDWLVRAERAMWCNKNKPLGEQYEEVPNCMVNIRNTDDKVLGTVTDRYKICQNAEAFDFTDHIIGKEGGAHFHTAGALYGGRVVWVLAKMDKVSLLGDNVEPYLLFSNSHDASTGIRVCLTPIRVVCNNTLTMAVSGSRRMWSTTHTGDLKAKLAEAQETLRHVKDYMEKMPEVATAMYESNIYADEVPKILEALFPEPIPKPGEVVSEQTLVNIMAARQDVFNIYVNAEDIQKFNGTSWGMYNAISDYAMHVKPVSDTDKTREINFMRGMEGHPLLGQAQKILATMVRK